MVDLNSRERTLLAGWLEAGAELDASGGETDEHDALSVSGSGS